MNTVILDPNYKLLAKYYTHSSLKGFQITSVKHIDEPTYLKIISLCIEYGLEVHVDNFSVISIITKKFYDWDKGIDKLQKEYVKYANERIKIRDFITKIESIDYKKPYVWNNEFTYPYSNVIKQIVLKTSNINQTLTIESEYMIQEILTYIRNQQATEQETIKRIYDLQVKMKNIKIVAIMLQFYLQNYTPLKTKLNKKSSVKQRQFIGKLLTISKIPEFIDRYDYETFAARDEKTHSIEAYVNTFLRDGLKYVESQKIKNENIPPQI